MQKIMKNYAKKFGGLQMGVKRLASLIEYLTAWGVENGVRFNDKYGFWGR